MGRGSWPFLVFGHWTHVGKGTTFGPGGYRVSRMSGVGRNDPCPCGSGRKFKRCCLLKQDTASAFTAHDRESALVKLGDYAFRKELDEERLAAGVAFWSGWLDAHPEGDGRAVLDFPESINAFGTWFAFDHPLAGGQLVVERMLQREVTRLTRGEREYLARMRDSHLGLYQVTDVKPDEAIRLIDLWSGEQVWVSERLGTTQLVRWDLLGVRLMRGADDALVIDGQPYLYPVRARDTLLRNLKRVHRDIKRAALVGRLEPIRFFKRVGMLFHYFWLEWVALRELPTLVTAEGERLTFARAFFEVRDREVVTAALGRHPDLERDDDGGYSWTEEASEFRRGLGRFVLERDRLVLETTSEQRVERGRAFLESIAGAAVSFRVVEYEDPERAMERIASTPRDDDAVGSVPPAAQAAFIADFYDRYYRDWLDAPVPALGDRTPREAARHKRTRPKVVALLQDLENASARERLQGRPAYDFGWMWAELGLTRP
jgi:SEC-C motif-containing protein